MFTYSSQITSATAAATLFLGSPLTAGLQTQSQNQLPNQSQATAQTSTTNSPFIEVSEEGLDVDPVLRGVPDPTAVIGHNGDEGYFCAATGRGTRLFHSYDLVDWTLYGRVFEADVPKWASDLIPNHAGIWAPDLTFHDGLYHLYYHVSSFGSQRSVMGLAVNESLTPGDPRNKWVDRGMVLESFPGKTNFNAIDSMLYVDDDGKWYLFWGSYWTGLKVTEADPKTGKPFWFKPGVNTTGKNPGDIIAIARNTQGQVIEGPYIVKRNGYYYMFVSVGNCCNGENSDYRVMVGRSKSPTGPYVDHTGKPMNEGGATLVMPGAGPYIGAGHNGVLKTPDRGDLMPHHAFVRGEIELGRQLINRPIYWLPSGWPVVGESIKSDYPEHAKPVRAIPAEPKPEDLIGQWQHRLNFKETAICTFTEDHQIIENGNSAGTWSIDGNIIQLTWNIKDGNGNPYQDVVYLEPTLNSYTGSNQSGVLISGVKIK